MAEDTFGHLFAGIAKKHNTHDMKLFKWLFEVNPETQTNQYSTLFDFYVI